MKIMSTNDNEVVQDLNELEELKAVIEDEFKIVQRLGREMLQRRRQNMKMRGNSAPGPRYLHDLTHIGNRVADRLLSVHVKIFRLIKQLQNERLPFLSEEEASRSLMLQHIERMERSLRRWDNIRYRLTMH